MNRPKRKTLRYTGHDYRSNAAYFITLCTKNKALLFSDPAAVVRIERVFLRVMQYFEPVRSPKFVVMPNHFHAIIEMYGKGEQDRSLSDIIKSFKREATKEYKRMMGEGVVPSIDTPIWQKSFYDHVIRDEKDYLTVWEYIENNPTKWELDKYYTRG